MCMCSACALCVLSVCVEGVGGGGDQVVPPPCGDPGEPDSVMLSEGHETRGLTTCGVPVPQRTKQTVDKTVRSSARKNVSLFHAKLKTRIACWNVRAHP